MAKTNKPALTKITTRTIFQRLRPIGHPTSLLLNCYFISLKFSFKDSKPIENRIQARALMSCMHEYKQKSTIGSEDLIVAQS